MSDEAPTLDLIGILGPPERLAAQWSTSLVHGQPVKGRPITLIGCHEMSHSFNGPGLMVQQIGAFRGALLGLHLGSEDDEVFDRVVIEVEHLGELVPSSGLLVQPLLSEDKVTGVDVRYESPSKLVAKLGSTEIHLAAGWMSGSPSTGSVVVNEKWAFEVVLDAPTTLSSVVGVWVERIRDLVSFCADRPCAVTAVRVGGPLTLAPSGAGHHLAEVHLPWIPAPTDGLKPLRHDEPVLRLLVDHDGFQSLMSSWVNVCEQLEVVLDLHFASDYAGFVYGETRFMNAVQAIEAYHRRRVPCEPLPIDIASRDRAIESCPEEVRPWLADKLRYAHEPGLRRRVKDLLLFSGQPTDAFWTSNNARSSLVSRLVDTRNALTHWDPAKPATLDGAELRKLSAFLRILLTSCVLRELGLSEHEAKSALAGNRRYHFEVSQFADA